MFKAKRPIQHCENVILNKEYKELQSITSEMAGGNGEAQKGDEEALKP